MPPKILGISGTNGSGKDTVAHLLEQDHNFLFISVSDLLRDELKKQSVPLT
ncbi:MAG: AAA family ATPase, partial [Candidatus Saccharimonadales bacterium]